MRLYIPRQNRLLDRLPFGFDQRPYLGRMLTLRRIPAPAPHVLHVYGTTNRLPRAKLPWNVPVQ